VSGWTAAGFGLLAEQVAAELGLVAAPAWEHGWESGAHLMAASGNGTGWSMSYPGGYGAKGMVSVSPVWPGRSWPPGGAKIKAGITASRGPLVIAARIRQLAPDYRLALADLAAMQARDTAEQARRDALAAQITALIPDDPDPDSRYPRVRVSEAGRSTMTEVYISGAGTVKFYREAAEIEIDRFRAPAEVVLAMLRAYAEGCASWHPVVLEIGEPVDYTHELRDPARPERPARPGRIDGPLRSNDEPRRSVRPVPRPELITGALRLLAAPSNRAGKQEADIQEKTGDDG
jgi:hypothetical protein